MRWSALPAALILFGCARAPEPEVTAAPKPKKSSLPKDFPTQLKVGTGEITVTDNTPAQLPVWSMAWKSGTLNVADLESGSAEAEQVSGEIMEKGKTVATYRADKGTGDRAAQLLTLEGEVRVESRRYHTVMTCDTIVYDANQRLIKARRNVRIDGDQGTIGPIAELWSTPDFSQIGTPDQIKTP